MMHALNLTLFATECTFRQFMQKAVQLPSPLSSPRQTPPPSSTSASVPIPGSRSPQIQQHSPLQSSTTVGTPSKQKKGPPSPLSLGAQSPPSPSFSSVAAGHSPKPTSSPLLLKAKGQGGNPVVINSSNRMMSGVGLPQIAAATVVSTSAAVFVGQNTSSLSRPGKLADITGPADSFDHVGFPFIVPRSGSTNHIMLGGLSILTTTEALDHQTDFNNTNNLLTFANNNNNFAQVPQTYGVYLNSAKGGGVGSGINSVAGSGSSVVASVSSRRNYRVASTSANSLKASPSPTSPSPNPNPGSTAGSATAVGGGFSGQVKYGTTNGGDIVSAASATHILDDVMSDETVTGKGTYMYVGFSVLQWWAGINSMHNSYLAGPLTLPPSFALLCMAWSQMDSPTLLANTSKSHDFM